MANYTVYQGTDTRYPSVRIRLGAKPTDVDAEQPKQIALVFDKGQTATQMKAEIEDAVKEATKPVPVKPETDIPVSVIGDFST